MDEATFRHLAADAIERVRGGLDAQDPDVVEAVLEAGVLKVQFAAGPPFVLNLQPPLCEVWLAADRQAWHFRRVDDRWIDKKSGAELFATLGALVSKRTGRVVTL